MNRISIICLGVKDMAQSIRFYRDGLGFATDEKEDSPKVVFFNTTGTKFELYPLKLLAEDINRRIRRILLQVSLESLWPIT